MTTTFKIDVAEKDITRAKRNNSYRCVIAQAIARCLPDTTAIMVDLQAIRFTRHGKRWIFMTPPLASFAVAAFDAGDDSRLQPFSFRLRDPAFAQSRTWTEAGLAKLRIQRKRAKGDTAAMAATIPPGPYRTQSEGRHPPAYTFARKHRSFGARILRMNKGQYTG